MFCMSVFADRGLIECVNLIWAVRTCEKATSREAAGNVCDRYDPGMRKQKMIPC